MAGDKEEYKSSFQVIFSHPLTFYIQLSILTGRKSKELQSNCFYLVGFTWIERLSDLL